MNLGLKCGHVGSLAVEHGLGDPGDVGAVCDICAPLCVVDESDGEPGDGEHGVVRGGRREGGDAPLDLAVECGEVLYGGSPGLAKLGELLWQGPAFGNEYGVNLLDAELEYFHGLLDVWLFEGEVCDDP